VSVCVCVCVCVCVTELLQGLVITPLVRDDAPFRHVNDHAITLLLHQFRNSKIQCSPRSKVHIYTSLRNFKTTQNRLRTAQCNLTLLKPMHLPSSAAEFLIWTLAGYSAILSENSSSLNMLLEITTSILPYASHSHLTLTFLQHCIATSALLYLQDSLISFAITLHTPPANSDQPRILHWADSMNLPKLIASNLTHSSHYEPTVTPISIPTKPPPTSITPIVIHRTTSYIPMLAHRS
jgi:hypothetical protein